MRGHYRILVGMAPGVGKTYRMLQEGHQALEEGRDVVIGYLESHDRPETAALAEGLEVVPRLRTAHGQLELQELDHHAPREALRGHRGHPRRRDRRHLDGQRPASREPERRDLRADRRARA